MDHWKGYSFICGAIPLLVAHALQKNLLFDLKMVHLGSKPHFSLINVEIGPVSMTNISSNSIIHCFAITSFSSQPRPVIHVRAKCMNVHVLILT